MTNRRERKRDFWQPNPWRRLLAFLCAFELLISVSGETAYAKNNNTIYSAPVTAPIRNQETPQPEEAAETPEPEGATVNTEEHTEVNSETEEPTETETTVENPEDNHNEQEEMPAAEETTGNQEDIPAAEETDIESGEKTETGTEREETETSEATGEEAVTEKNEGEIPPAPEKIYTSGSLQAETEDCSVQINYTEAACIPDETTLAVTQARGADLYAALKSAAKVIRNDEDEIWKRQIADEGNAFYLLSLTDTEGNEVYPGAQVELILEQKNRPDGTTCFLTGENARILDEEEGKISVKDYSMEPVGYATIQLIQTGIVTKEYSGADYIVTASYGPEANFPANTEMKVREIRPDTPEYALYSGLTEEALAEEWNEITLERYFDITFISGGKEVEPSGNVDVQIVFKDVIELTEEHDIQAVHFENKEAVVIESETDSIDEEAKRSEEVIDTVSFTSDSFSVFGVVQRTKITQKMLAADGNTYEINVTYGPDAGIPENAELLVEEIIPGSDLWEAYRKQTAAALGADDVRLPGLYDISILVDGQKIEPLTPVNVSVRLVNAESGEELHVVHFTEELPEKLAVSGDKQTEVQSLATEERIASEKITDAVVEGDTVTFDTDGFSVYAFAYTVVVYYRTVSGENYRITLDYGPDSGIPAGAELQVEELLPGNERYTEYLEKALRTITASEDAGGPVDENVDEAAENEADGEDKEEIIEDIFIPEDQYARFFDIEIRADGQKIEPTGSVSVTFELVDAPEGRIDDLKVIHFVGDDADVLKTTADTGSGIQITTESFSVYGVILAPNNQPQNNLQDLDSRTFTIRHGRQYLTSTVSNTDTKQFWKDDDSTHAAVWTFEATETAGVYRIFTVGNDGTKLYMNLIRKAGDPLRANAVLSTNPQNFTVTAANGGYRLSTTSGGTTYYLNEFNGGVGFAGWYQTSNNYDIMTLDFKDPVMETGKQYMVLVKYNGKYYIVNNDATLTEVGFDPVKNRVIVDNPMLWTVDGNNPNRHIYFNSEATGYDWQQLASDYYRRYLNPADADGITEENSGNVSLQYGQAWWDNEQGVWVTPSTVSNRANILNQTALNYYNQRVYRQPWGDNNHFGVELDSNGNPVRLIGQQSAGNNVEILFADATEVDDAGARNHTVNHIDISIAGDSRVTVPLAYGTYYYQDADTGEWIEYNVTTNTSLDLSSPVAIDSEDMKHASIKAYDKNNNELDDAFVITGYSSNAHTDVSAVQVRIEGSFKVANPDAEYERYWWGLEDANSDRMNQLRLENQITYVVSAIKNLDFSMVDPVRGQLYEKLADGTYKPLSINMDVDMTASFTYFDPANECPPVHWSQDLWERGGIIDGSGMDYVLGGDTQAANTNVVALEVTKQIVDEDGMLVHPSEKIIHSVDIYGNTAKDGNGLVANPNIVADVNVDQYTTDFVPSGYTKFHSKNIAVGPNGMTVVYDYAIKPGMYYVTEDKNTVAESFVDTAGDTWEYKGTYITTEYVRRGNQYDDKAAYPDPQHYSKTYTMDDPVFEAVPEVVGTFKRLDNVETKNGIVEFYVYNVYVNTSETSLEAEKQWAEGTEVPEDAEVIFELYYAKREITHGGEPVETPEEWPDYEEYLPVREDSIFGNGIRTILILDEASEWKGSFIGLPKTWRDGEGNVWELDYYAVETAVMVNGENVLNLYAQETEKEEAESGEENNSDGKVTITNTIQKTSTTVKKVWSDEASHYDDDSLTLKLIRYRKNAPPEPEKGTLNISHFTSGLPGSPQLPAGFTVSYSYSGPVSASGVSAGQHLVPPGQYTVTATVTNSAAPTGYTYRSTTEAVTVTVPEGGTAAAEFTSSYVQSTGMLDISHYTSGLPISPRLPDGFTVTYSYSGPSSASGVAAGRHTVIPGEYTVTANVTNNAAPAGYSYGETNGPITVTVPAVGTGNAQFTSTYSPRRTAEIIIYRTNYGYQQYYYNNSDFYEGDSLIISWTRQGHNPGGYTINNENYTAFPHTQGYSNYTDRITYTIPTSGDYRGRVYIQINDPWSDISTVSVHRSLSSLLRTGRARAYAGAVSGGAGRMRSSTMPDDYGLDDTWSEMVVLTAAEDWTKVIEDLDICDQLGQPYYYAIVEENVPIGYEVSYSNMPVIATELEDTELTADNTYTNPTTGNLIVSKTVNGNAANPEKAFAFTVTAQLEGEPIPDGIYGEMTFNGGIAVFALADRETRTAEDLPDGTVFTVSEDEDEEGYTSTSIGEKGTIVAGDTKYADFTNTLDTFADLVITKTVTGEIIDEEKEFEFTVTLAGHTGKESFEIVRTSGNSEPEEENTEPESEEEPEYLVFNDGKATITLKHNERLTIKGLPNGTEYSITEADYTPAYYEPVTTGASGTITGGENAVVNASFINPKVPVVEIEAEKQWVTGEYELKATAVQFTLMRQAGDGEPEPVETATVTEATNWTALWTDQKKYVDGALPAEQRMPYVYSVVETGIYFGELEEDLVPENAWVTDKDLLADIYMTEGGEVTMSGENMDHGSATITNEPVTTSVLVEKKWPEFEEDTSFEWSSSFRLLADKTMTEDAAITITRNTPEEDRTFTDLPKYRVDENGEATLIDYTLQETAYTVYENGELRYSFDGTTYYPGSKQDRYLAYYETTTDEETGAKKISVRNEATRVKSIRVSKEWMGVPYEETVDLPSVTFALCYRYGPGWGNAAPYEDATNFDYSSIELNYENEWTWECPVELPEEYRYFVIETPLNKHNWHTTQEHVLTDPLLDEFPILIDGYRWREEIDTGEWSGLVHYNQARDAYIGNKGEIKIQNKLPGYMQMDLKKKFLEYRDDGNGGYSLYTTTGESENMSDMIIELQVMRRTVDASSGQDVYLTGWQNYGRTVKIGYDPAGNDYIDNPNPFKVVHQGSWNFQIVDNNVNPGLPKLGLYRKSDGTIIVVRYQYIYKEVQVYDGSLNPIGDQWTAWLPYAWDANGNKIKVSELQTAQDQDRMLNVPGQSLHIEKEWFGKTPKNVKNVYVKVERREYGTNGPYEDYLDVIRTEMNLGGVSQNHFASNNALVYDYNMNRIMLNEANGWNATIDKVQIFPNGNNRKQYEYRIVETGYMDQNDVVHETIESFMPVTYYRHGRDDNGWVEQGNGVLLTREGPNKLKVRNIPPRGALEIIKQVPDPSKAKADTKDFMFEVTMVVPDGSILRREDLSTEGGAISAFTMSGNTAVLTVSRHGTGSVILDGIPYGTTYEVTETDVPEGWLQEGETVYSDTTQTVERPQPEPNEHEIPETDKATVTNTETTSVASEKVWRGNGTVISWPEGIDSVTVGLYQSVNGAEPAAVMDGSIPRTLTFGSDAEPEERTFTDLPVYDAEGQEIIYSIQEISINTPEGSFEVVNGTVTVTGQFTDIWLVSISAMDENRTVTITNSKTEIQLLKVDEESSEALAGAEFRLEKATDDGYEVIEAKITMGNEGENLGRAYISGLTDGTYRLKETKAPPGYIPLASMFDFKIEDGIVIFESTGNGVEYDGEMMTFTIRNKAGLALPSTGGSGTLPYTAGGLSLILMAVLLKLMKKRRKNYQ